MGLCRGRGSLARTYADPDHERLLDAGNGAGVVSSRVKGAMAFGPACSGQPYVLSGEVWVYGFSTIFTQWSSLCRNMSYPMGASSSRKWCVMTKLGSISPF